MYYIYELNLSFFRQKGLTNMSKEYLTFKEAMKYLDIKSHNTLRYYIKQGLPVIKLGNSKRISKNAIDEFMQAHTTAVHPTKEVVNHD